MQEPLSNNLHNRISDFTPRLRALDRKLSNITASICGNAPESGDACAKPSIDTIHDKLDIVGRIITSMEEEIIRLENTVGQDASLNAPKAPTSR